MANFGEIKVTIDAEPTEVVRQLIRQLIRRELADVLKNMGEADVTASGDGDRVIRDEHGQVIAAVKEVN